MNMSRGFPSMTALLGLLAIAGYQNRDKLSEMIGGLGGGASGAPGGAGGLGSAGGAGGLGGLGGLLSGLGGAGAGGLLSGGLGELVDRFGEAPDEVDNLSEQALLKIDMRDLRLRALEAGPGRVVVTLGADALLDGMKVAGLVQRSKGVYRLTPDMKLVVKLGAEVRGPELIVEAKKVLRDLHTCALPEA